MTTTTDPWQVLGVARDADDAAMRRAYRLRARQSHPDHGGTAESFRKVQQAWEQLRSAHSDREADQVRPQTAMWQPRVPPGGWRRVTVRPGPRAWLRLPVLIGLTVVWAFAGLALVVPHADPSSMFGFSWAGPGVWWVVVWVPAVTVSAVRGIAGHLSFALIVAGVLVVVAAFGGFTWWWWACAVWVVFGLVGPLLRAGLDQPLWTIEEALEDGPVFGAPEAAHEDTAYLVELLCVIPAVRVFHDVPGVGHLVVCGEQVAAFGAATEWAFPGTSIARRWTLGELAQAPDKVLDQAAAWLTNGGGGAVVNRRVLADVTA